jgi:N-acetylglucosaminyldiphosphoundecaprenol N-acetyl-beta-D-mannosaminyltransferase
MPRTAGGIVTYSIFGVRLDEVASEEELRRICGGFLDGSRTARVFTPNPEILLMARSDPGYARVLASADLALADGTGVAVVRRLRGHAVRRWPGVDLGAMLLHLGAERGASVAFVGGTPPVADRAAARWRSTLPRLELRTIGAGVGFDETGAARSSEDEERLVEEIRAAEPAVLLVALGAPKQERWIARHADDFPSVRIMAGVGGSLDMWAEHLPRAPKAIRRFGLEWAWRLFLEPSRWKRVVRATIVFPAYALLDRSRA